MTNFKSMTGEQFTRKIKQDVEKTHSMLGRAIVDASKELVNMSTELSWNGTVSVVNLSLAVDDVISLASQLKAQKQVLAACEAAPAPLPVRRCLYTSCNAPLPTNNVTGYCDEVCYQEITV